MSFGRGLQDRLRHGWLRRLLVVAVVLAAIVIIIRVFLDPVAAHFTRKGLNEAEGIRGTFDDVHVTVFPPGYEIRKIKIIEDPGGSWKKPLFFAERVKVRVDWRQLFRARLSASTRIEEPKIIVSARTAKRAEEPAKEAKEKAKRELPDVEAALEKVIPARVSRIEVIDGELLFRSPGAPRSPEIWLHDLELSAENFATREGLAGGRPATVSARGTLGKTGTVTFFTSANPFAEDLEFAGKASLRDWKLEELYDLTQPATKLQTPEGTISLFAEFRGEGGRLNGGVKPVLKNVEVRPTEEGLGNKLKAWVADTGLEIFSDRVPGRNAVATVIPIKGRIDQPDIQLWPTILGVIRNAFVEGISGGFAHLPPKTAEKKQGILGQAKEAFDKDEGPPEAQPTEGQEQDEQEKQQKKQEQKK